MDGQEHVVTALRHLTGTGRTRVKNILTHICKDYPGLFKRVGAAPTHKCQGTRRRRGNTAGHRAVHETDSQPRRNLANRARSCRIDGAAIQYCGRRVQLCQQSVVTEIGGGHMFARRQHGDHIVDPGGRLRSTFGHRRAHCLELRQGSLGQIKNSYLMPRLDQIGGHRPTHVAQPDKRNLCHN